MPTILQHSIENGCHIEESRQLLSYWLIHPAVTAAERAQFTLWLTHLEERCSSAHHVAHAQQHGGTSGGSNTQQELEIFALEPGRNGGAVIPQWRLSQPPPGHPALSKASSTTSRDSGVGEQDIAHGGSSAGAAGPRAITACNHGNSTAATEAGSATHLGGNLHKPLHATHSGPPAFSSASNNNSTGMYI